MNGRWSGEWFCRRRVVGFCTVFGVAAGVALAGTAAKAQSASDVARIAQTLPEGAKAVIARLSQFDELPAETWLQQSRYTANIASRQPIVAVTVDPDHVLPDNDRSNNALRPPN